jgi:O-antigen/teichoic acid export membrane protein
MSPRKFLRDTLGFAATQYAVRAALMLRGLIAARLLGPTGYGAWNGMTLIWDYGLYAHLGTQQGLEQTLPAEIVDGDRARLQHTLRAALFNTLVLTMVFAVAALIYFSRGSGALQEFWGVRGISVALLCVLLVNVAFYHLTLLRSLGDIRSVSTWFILQGAIGVVIGLALIPATGAWGLLWGWLLANVVALAYLRSKLPAEFPVAPAPSATSLTLIHAGFPMLMYLGSSLVLRTLDRLIVLRFLGARDLGFYSIGVLALTLLFYLPDSVGYVLYPELLKSYRQGGDRPEAIRDRVIRTLGVLSLLVPALCGLAFLYARQVVMLALPAFLPGATATRVLCFGAAGLAVARIASITLVTLRRQRLLFPAAISVVVMACAADFVVLRAGQGINGVAWATLTVYVAHGAIMLWLSAGALGIFGSARLRLLVRTFFPLALAIGVALLLARTLPWLGSMDPLLRIARLALATVLFLVIYVGCLFPLARGLGLRRMYEALQLGGAGSEKASEEPVA